MSSYPSQALLTPRTQKYVQALIREGDNFDYFRWLKRTREEEAQAKQVEAASPSAEMRPNPALPLIPKTIPVPAAIRRPHPQAKSKTPKARLMRWLEKTRDAWEVFQASRARDAVYEYLEAVFAIVEHYKVRRRTKKLLRQAFKFAYLPFDKTADPFTAVIRCTSDDNVDSKTISKWARALRYVARSKEPRMRLKKFMKKAGGVNACADLYVRYLGRGARREVGYRKRVSR
jgi:hypothetical protein